MFHAAGGFVWNCLSCLRQRRLAGGSHGRTVGVRAGVEFDRAAVDLGVESDLVRGIPGRGEPRRPHRRGPAQSLEVGEVLRVDVDLHVGCEIGLQRRALGKRSEIQVLDRELALH
jgi:hypothetical protein